MLMLMMAVLPCSSCIRNAASAAASSKPNFSAASVTVMPRKRRFASFTTPLMMIRSQPSVMAKLSQSGYSMATLSRKARTPSAVPRKSSAAAMSPFT